MKDSTLDYYQRTLQQKKTEKKPIQPKYSIQKRHLLSSLPTLPEEGRMRSEVILTHPVKAGDDIRPMEGYSSRGVRCQS